MKFLSETNYRTEIERVLSNNEPTDVAVAFWGKDSLSLFDPNAKKKIRIICNLESAGCNPTAIRGLIKHTNICVKSNKHLHAKILLQKTSIIIGSANISANGLSLEGSELNGWIEAGIVVKDQSAIKDSAKWYNQLWKSSSIITNEMLVTAEKLWLTRRNQRPMKKNKKISF